MTTTESLVTVAIDEWTDTFRPKLEHAKFMNLKGKKYFQREKRFLNKKTNLKTKSEENARKKLVNVKILWPLTFKLLGFEVIWDC